MQATKNRWLLAAIIAAVILILAAVIIVITLGGGDNQEDPSLSADPTPTVEVTPEPAANTGYKGDYSSGSNSGTKQPTKAPEATPAPVATPAPEAIPAPEAEKSYGDKVKDGVKEANQKFEDVLNDIGKSYSNGDLGGMASTIPDFAKGVYDHVTGVVGSVVGGLMPAK